MKISFTVTPYSDDIYAGLNMQIIPYDLQRNPNCNHSIVIDEIAFSLVEYLFFGNEDPWSHWENTYLDAGEIAQVIAKLDTYKVYLEAKKYLRYNDNVRLLFKQETKLFKKKYPRYKADVIKMMDDLIRFLTNLLKQNIDGLTIIGV
ncbi:hypothetical protein KTJ32_15610 [Acinetobacter gyllenbergii]|uniref:hypothetical protein n=1 Tax=Acinetobacter gyllenbergii TaxID=134534 RepID=UPI0021CE30FF|nr:hypothetical protein [Acinetobacter gyllenbergii]MCU4582422.1 hypothetical protein [Acinetobacter gyllenbergii]